jgi:hypothetical protein
MLGKIFYLLGLIDKEGPIEFIEDRDNSILPIYNKHKY